jgi:subtilisin family serine protease
VGVHPHHAGRNVLGCNLYCVEQACALNCSDTDKNGHGTHVAGIVAASGGIRGMAPKTGQSIRISEAKKIKVFNLFFKEQLQALKDFVMDIKSDPSNF